MVKNTIKQHMVSLYLSLSPTHGISITTTIYALFCIMHSQVSYHHPSSSLRGEYLSLSLSHARLLVYIYIYCICTVYYFQTHTHWRHSFHHIIIIILNYSTIPFFLPHPMSSWIHSFISFLCNPSNWLIPVFFFLSFFSSFMGYAISRYERDNRMKFIRMSLHRIDRRQM